MELNRQLNRQRQSNLRDRFCRNENPSLASSAPPHLQ
uniref:Uncharacterized protein n=1 Tax=Arundo donax TaxID=35708 RepID=A0A0A9H825_ARUDO